MPISVGDTLPGATLTRMGPDGPETVDLGEKLKGRRVVIFAVPGAFTPTCHSAHVPSFIRTKDGFAEKGIDEIICIAVNDPFVLGTWAKATGAEEAGITMLADAESAFTKAVGMNFSAPPVGFIDRSIRYALVAEDGVVQVFHEEESRGVCEATGGEALLAAI
ncbi:Putative peroxiredoxin [Roseivivax sp. THAF40]|uniref:peroxiredoxin n=1 Tax=unclassified Roseivivax TaxID=2639302 RepID=UPI00126911D8|nr:MULTISPECIES: peroxiredoxin [unclassified Roseivivax]QFS84317.1 Putative peroxiredoxin [Roseivivax sp. THAF197b]QFT48145.1 Putative peroxiredoxin [Roseivivax sp. THAF40]